MLGGQLTLGMMGLVEGNSTNLNGALTLAPGPLVIMQQGSIGQTTTDVGDLYPQAIIRWNNGVHNWMVTETGDIPVGDYSSTNLANIGIGHGAVDGGGGLHVLQSTDRPRIFRGDWSHLQPHQSKHELPKWHRLAPGLGCFAILIKAASCGRSRLLL